MSLLFFTFFILSTCIVSNICDELLCYECNSMYDGMACENGENLSSMSMFVKLCAGKNASYIEEYERPLCRKIDQRIKTRNNMRVVKRSCGWERQGKNDNSFCYTYKTQDHEEVVCQCFDKYCNSAHDKSSNVYWTAAYSLLVLLGILMNKMS